MSDSMSKIIRTTADVMFLFITVFGFYIVLHGHLTPGGGFQGGAVIATGFILLIVAYKLEDFLGWFQKKTFQSCEMSGLILFIGTALAAIPLGSGEGHRGGVARMQNEQPAAVLESDAGAGHGASRPARGVGGGRLPRLPPPRRSRRLHHHPVTMCLARSVTGPNPSPACVPGTP